jgi:hypothetical protein
VTTPAATPVSTPPAPAQGVAAQEAGKKGKQAAGTAGTAASPAQQLEQLPFTGLETLWLALAGAGMLALGLVLRARASSPKEVAVSADDLPDSSGKSTTPRLGDLGMAISQYESLGSMLIGAGSARLGAGPLGIGVASHARMRLVPLAA